jgi:2-oxoglutarate ferredoxin oxidoreductase subunit beta
MVTHSDYLTKNTFTWCTNCGNYGVWGALRNALVASQISPKDVMFIHDIGCNGNGADKINGYGFKGLHGRAIPLGAGATIANSKMKLIGSSGDGAVLAEGVGHLVHAIRSNYNMTFMIHNNGNYALTTGQASPATKQGVPMNSSPYGATADTVNILSFILPLKPSFVARGFTGDQKQLASLLEKAIAHKGFSIVEIMQYCPTYNHVTSNDWFNERVYDVNDSSKTGVEYDIHNFGRALEVVQDLEEKIATGIIYIDPNSVEFMDRQQNRVGYTTQLIDEVKPFDVSGLLEKFK